MSVLLFHLLHLHDHQLLVRGRLLLLREQQREGPSRLGEKRREETKKEKEGEKERTKKVREKKVGAAHKICFFSGNWESFPLLPNSKHSAMPLPEAEKIPTTLVVGFLGAGKSSLINHILASRPTKADGSTTRCAVVENELGEVGIDSHLGECFDAYEGSMGRDAPCRLSGAASEAGERASEREREGETGRDAGCGGGEALSPPPENRPNQLESKKNGALASESHLGGEPLFPHQWVLPVDTVPVA